METRTYQGHTYQRSGPSEPWTLVAPALPAGGQIISDPAAVYAAPKAAASLAETRASLAHTEAETRRMAAQAPTDAAMAQANLTKAQADASVAQQKADEAKANAALSAMAPNSTIHGEAYLEKFVPPAQREMVRAYARGDLGSRAGGMSTSMLPIMQHAMNYDPSTSATTFPARVKMQQDLAGNQPGTVGGALRSMEQMLLHGNNVLTTGAALDNYGPGIVGSVGNAVRTRYERAAGDPTLNAYEQEVKNYAPESQKGVAGAAGIGAEREERAAGYAASMPQAARVAALQADARMALERIGAVNDQYKRLMGRDITDQLSPAAKRAYDNIMAGGYDKAGKALHPAPGYVPGSVFKGDGTGGDVASPPTFDPNGGGLSGGIATGATHSAIDPTKAPAVAALQALLRSGASDDQVRSAARDLNAAPASVAAALTFRHAHPGYRGSYDLSDLQLTEKPTAAPLDPVTAGVISFGNAATGGLPNLLSGGKVDAVGEAQPTGALVGNLIGSTAGVAGLEGGVAAGLTRFGVSTPAVTTWAPRIGDTLYGAINGVTGDPEHPVAAALLGGGVGLGSGISGRAIGRGAGEAFRGVQDPAVLYLRAAGVPLTAGQAAGGLLKRTEDALSSVPVVGDMVNARRLEGVRTFNRVALDQGLAPIGASTNGVTGAAGIDAARAARSQAYRDALDPVSLVPDQPFRDAQLAADTAGQRLPEDMATRAQFAIDRADDNIDPATGTMTGQAWQQAVRRFRRTASANAALPNGDDLGDVMRQAEQAHIDLLNRQAPAAVPAFAAANEANRNVEVLRAATNAARNGTRSGEVDLFTPSQLSDAAAANARKFGNTAGTTDQPFYDLTRAGQSVLPSNIPDSGTARRLATMALTGTAGGGAGYLAGDTQTGGEAGLGVGALLALGGTRTGQSLIARALLDRSPELVRVGDMIYSRSAIAGMLAAGSASGELRQ